MGLFAAPSSGFLKVGMQAKGKKNKVSFRQNGKGKSVQFFRQLVLSPLYQTLCSRMIE